MRGEVAAALAIVALLVGAGAGYVFGVANQRTAVSPTTVTSAVTETLTMQSPYTECEFVDACSTANPSGIVLSMELNATIVSSNGSLAVRIDESNPTRRDVNMSVADNWYIGSLPSLWVCYTGSPPYGVAVFRGYYTLQNVSAAKDLINASEYPKLPSCIYGGNITGFNFKPGASFKPVGGLTAGFPNGVQFDATDSPNRSSSFGEYSLWSSKPAVYTIALGDEWGDLALAHFTVVPPLQFGGKGPPTVRPRVRSPAA